MPGWADLKYSARSLTRAPAATFALVLTIAIGIGSNAVVVGFVRGLLTRDLPLPQPESIVSLFGRDERGELGPLSAEAFESLTGHGDVFARLGAARESQETVLIGGRSIVAATASVTSGLAEILDLPRPNGIVLSHRLTQMEFGEDGDPAGTEIRVGTIDGTVAGAAPPWLEGLYLGSAVDVWMPAPDRGRIEDRRGRTLWVIGRLQPGIDAERVEALVNAQRGAADGIAVHRYTGTTPEMAIGMRRLGTLLGAAAAAVFLIACANVAMFLLSRGAARARETSVRVALGASRGQLARQLLMDSALVAAIGGALGMLLAMWTADLVPAFLFEEDAERLVFVPDVLGIVAASAVCAAVAAACGLMPLVEVRHDDPAAVLRRESAGPSRTMRRVRAGMVAGQMACCCVLVIATGLLFSGFREAVQTDRGDRLGPAVLATVKPRSALTRGDLALEYYEAIGRAGQSVPRVASTGWAWRLPNSQPVWQTLRIERQDAPRREVVLNVVTFTPDELARIQVPPLHGRMFSGEDTAQACRVAIVNESAARTHFGGDAVGRAIVDEAGARLEIIGIVAMQKDHAAAPPTIYHYGPQNDAIERTGPTRFRVPDWSDEPRALVDVNSASNSYFTIMGFRTTDGVLYPGHPAPGDCRTAVVNTEAATLHFGGHAVGAAVIDGAGRRTEIVGVVESPVIRTSQRRPEPSIFFPVAQDVRPRMSLVLAARDVDDELVSAVRRSLEPVPGGETAPSVETFERYLMRTALASERISTVLVGGYALTALVLGILGLQGAMSDAIRQRRRELAVRVALGAQRWRVVRQIFMEGLRLAALGTTAGMIAALLAARWLAGVVPSAAAPGPWVWMGAALALLVAVTIASVLPARRALAVAPLSVMRAD